MIVRFGTDTQKERWVPRLARGEVIGWVAMTEPEAGSDVGNVRTTATRQADGTWRINGRKQFISSGNGDVGVLLARAVPGSRGLDGLALFLVPRCVDDAEHGVRENFTIERAEEKVCINGSPTCALSFEGSQAEIMGSPGDGWRQITTFMNEARIAVGIQACGVAQASLRAAQDYAAQRVQMNKPIREHPLVAEMLLDMDTSVAGMRALWMEAAVAYDLVQGIERRLHGLSEVDPERPTLEARKRRLERYLRELTPLVKYYGAEEAISVARTGMQVFGGYGVVKDYEVERFLRDSLILPIYEGTSQIQSLMATKDLLKVVMRDPRALLVPGGHSPWLAGASFDGDIGRLYREALRNFGRALAWLMFDLGRQIGPRRAAQVVRGNGGLDENDLGYVLLSAERLTRMLAYLHTGRLLGQQAQRWPARQALAERFMKRTADVCALEARRVVRGDRDALVQVFERAMGSLLADVERIVADTSMRPSAQLRLVVQAHVEAVCDNLDALTVYLHEFRALAGETLANVRTQRERYRQLVSQIVERGVRLGEFGAPDVDIATLGLLGMCNWVAQWYRPAGRLSAGQIGAYFADLALEGLKRAQPLEPSTISPSVSPNERTSDEA
jgi:alkylation response protein AidB-like acyl-CoA dehydrogenase